LAEASQLAEERISNARTVKTCSREVAETESYGLRLEKVMQLAIKESMARGIFFGMVRNYILVISLCIHVLIRIQESGNIQEVHWQTCMSLVSN
jgi:ABC-type multidrug transport system fused ATPase/permease subunit